MPRSTSTVSPFLTAENVTTRSTIHITPSGGGTELYLATAALNDGVHAYEAYLKSIGELRQSLARATDRVSVVLYNDDQVRGLEVANGVRAYRNADVEIGRYWEHATLGTAWATLFKGKIAAPEVTDREVRFDVIDPLSAAGLVIAARPMSVKCPFRYKDTLTCTYTGSETTCNKNSDSQMGCTGHGASRPGNIAHFGGWYFPYPKTGTAPSGGGDPGGGGGGGGVCFVGDTLVTMADGSQKPIKYVQKGDRVMCFYYDEGRGEDVVVTEVVDDVYVHDEHEYFRYRFSDGNQIGVTPEHPLYVRNGAFKIAGSARLLDQFKGLDMQSRSLKDNRLVRAAWVAEPVPVYNLNVRFFHTYFANGIAVHNRKPIGDP